MKLKYYLRGLGVGILVTTVILMIASVGKGRSLSDQEIMKRAEELGMVMAQEEKETDTPNSENMGDDSGTSEKPGEAAKPQPPGDPEGQGDTQPPTEDETEGDAQQPTDPEAEGDAQQPTDPEAEGDAQQPPTGSEGDIGGETPPAAGTLIPVEVIAGDVSNTVCQKLLEAGLITDGEDFNRYLSDNDKDGLLAVGIHHIPMGATYEEIAELLCQVPES